MKVATYALLPLALAWPSALAVAQTGKIAGTVVDENQDPLPGVNVIIEETSIGSVTDDEGFFAILNVRPGTYSLRGTFVGFTPVVIQGVRVAIHLTTEIDFVMQEQAIGLDELVVTAQRPIIQRDVAGSERVVDAEEITSGKYQDVGQVLTAQVAVNKIGSVEDRPEIRGSFFNESLFIVDGVNYGDPLTNQPHYQVNLDAVEEFKLQTGGFSAEYGNVRSGVINVVTREGGDRYSGSLNVQYSPAGYKHFGPGMFDFDSPLVQPFVNRDAGAFSGNDFFSGWNQVASELSEGEAHAGASMELYARYLWRHRSQDAIDELKRLQDEGIVRFVEGVDPDDLVWHQTGVVPDYRLSATLSGPAPVLDAVKFLFTYNGTQAEYAYRFPDHYRDRNFRGKLTTTVGRGKKLNVHGFYGVQRGGDGGQGPGIGGFVSSNPYTGFGSTNKFWYPDCAVPGERTRQIYGTQWRHALSSRTFYELNLMHDRVDYRMRRHLRNTAPIPGSGGIPSSSKTSGSGIDAGRIGTEAEAEARASAGDEGWQNWRDWALIRIGDHWYDEAPKGYGPVNWRDVTGEYRMESCNLRRDDTNTRGWDGSGSLTTQLDRNNQIKAGFQFRLSHNRQYYEQIDPSVNSGNVWSSEMENQIDAAAYLQDKLEFQGFVANVGVRLDLLRTGAFPVLLDCDLLDTDSCLGDSGPFTQWVAAGNTTVDAEGGSVLGTKEAVISENVSATSRTHARISPRFGISHPISTVAKVFVNYGHFYQWPRMVEMYQLRMDTRRGFRVVDVGNPLLKPSRTIQYEVGYEQNLFDKMNLRLTGYYKDVNSEIGSLSVRPLSYGGSGYSTWTNRYFRDVRGFESFFELRRDVVRYFSGWISANYLVESGASYGYSTYYEDPSRQATLFNTQVSNPDVRPIIKANVNFELPDDFLGPRLGAVSLLGGLNLGLSYTWRRGARFTYNPAEFPLVEDNMRWRPYRRWDLRLSKSLFRTGTYQTVFYVDVSNLFNTRNMTAFSGEANVSGWDSGWGWDSHRWWRTERRDYLESLGYTAENQNRDGTFDDTIGRPGDWKDDAIDMPAFSPWTFLERRDIFFGVRLHF